MLALLFLLCATVFAAIPDQIGTLAICAQGCITSAIFECDCPAANFTCACQCPTFRPFTSSCLNMSCATDHVGTSLDTISSICTVIDPPPPTPTSTALPTSDPPSTTTPTPTASSASAKSTSTSASNSTSLSSSRPIYSPCIAQPTQSRSFVVCNNGSLANGTSCTFGPNQTCLPTPIQYSAGTNVILMWSFGFYFLALCPLVL